MTAGRRRTHALHLDTGARQSESHGYDDVGGALIERALNKPLLPSWEGSDYSIARVIDNPVDQTLVLEVREDALWPNGRRVTAEQVRRSLGQALERDSDFALLWGARDSAVSCDSNTRVLVRFEVSNEITERWLASPAFAPRQLAHHADSRGTGCFRRSGDRLVSRDCELILEVERSEHAAVEAFVQGRISITCPTAFDLAARMSGSADFRPCEPDVHAVAIINPERAPTLWTDESRAFLSECAHDAPLPASVLLREELPHWATPRSPGQTGAVSVLFGDYWPNRQIAERLKQALQRAGAPNVQLEAVGLDELADRLRRLDFDIILRLEVGLIGPRRSLAMWLAGVQASLGGEDVSDLVSLFRSAMAAPGDTGLGDQLCATLLRALPVLPLYRFRSGYLATSDIPRAPLVNGCHYPAEMIA